MKFVIMDDKKYNLCNFKEKHTTTNNETRSPKSVYVSLKSENGCLATKRAEIKTNGDENNE